MMWTIRLVVCLVAVSSYSDATRLEEFLQEKQTYLDEFDSLFDALYFNATAHMRVGSADTHAQRQVLRSQPLPSPDWSTHSISFDDVTDEESDDYLDPSQATLFEDENYRPREKASGREVWVEDVAEDSSEEGSVFSGDSGLFLTGKPGDDEEEYEDVGSGDSRTKTTSTRRTTSIVRETSTSVPVEESNGFELECRDGLRVEIKSCIEFSCNVRTMLREMEALVAQSGYYNVSSSQYFYQLFRTCASSIAGPSSCLQVASSAAILDVVHNVATRATIAFSARHGADPPADQRSLDCFQTHLQFLGACLGARVSGARLETLARAVVARARDATAQECQDLAEVRQCVVGATTRCQDSISVSLVGEMFQAARDGMTTCSKHDKQATAAAPTISSGSVATLVLSVLALGLHKQIN